MVPVTLVQILGGLYNEKKTASPCLPPPKDDRAKQKKTNLLFTRTHCLFNSFIHVKYGKVKTNNKIKYAREVFYVYYICTKNFQLCEYKN